MRTKEHLDSKYNCRQEFQIHDEILKTNYKVGRISDTMPEHYLVQGECFMVQDVFSKADVLKTTAGFGAPNFRQVQGSLPLFGMGQPSVNGFKQVLQKLQAQGHEEVIFLCVREEPVVFLHKDDDFVPYTPRKKENLHENLHGLKREESAESLEITIRKELHDFAKLNENVFYVYNDIEFFRDEPQKMSISCEEDIHVTEEVFKRPLFTMPKYRYHRLPLPSEGAPLEDDFDAFVKILRSGDKRFSETKPLFQVIQKLINKLPNGPQLLQEVDHAISLCSEMHNIKEAIYENKSKLEGIGEDYQIQGSSTKDYFLKRTMQSLERYFYLIVFNAYLHEQVSDEYLAPDLLSTVKEMKAANFRRVPKMPVYGMRVRRSCLTSQMKRGNTDIFVGESSGGAGAGGEPHIYTVREPSNVDTRVIVPSTDPQLLQKLETSLSEAVVASQKWLEVTLEQDKQMKMFKSVRTVQDIFTEHKNSHQGLVYRRIPLPEYSAPREQDFDKLLESMKSTLAEDSHSAFVFHCSNGKGRTTTATVIAVLTLWNFNGFPDITDDEIVSVPDAKYTKGEFEVVMQLVRLLPDGHRMKREVDMALDSVSETMTPMHYHLREVIICTYRQIKSAKSEPEAEELLLRSLQYLERYIYLILFNTYLHLEKRDSWGVLSVSGWSRWQPEPAFTTSSIVWASPSSKTLGTHHWPGCVTDGNDRKCSRFL
ncbi:hypothetical protein WMY93_017247 [Mugilogobius chulae]|uniref:Tyrosine specific protein phosphatases domain-containing protein n=1 Tax=Mugilogobius chulae TaxID=88201 RepID=A0AAW0NSH6_9GOBI